MSQKVLHFYHWSPQWRDKPQTHEVMMEVLKGNTSTAISIATCKSAEVATQIAALLEKDYKESRQ